MADKSFGVRELNLTNTSGTPTVSSPNQLNLSAHTVAISTSVTVGQNLTVSANAGISSLNVTGIGTVLNLNVLGVGTITSPSDANAHSRWKVTNQSASAYRFTGPGQDGSENNPNVYLVRGQRYIFDVNASGHPFQLRVANGGAAYSDGVTNNGAQSGQVIFNVQHDAPAQLYYQCTNHGSMVGNIYIVGGPQVISGVLTATSFSGSGANLTGITQTTINNNADNRIITGSGTANTLEGNSSFTYTGSVVTHSNPSGLAKLDVKGDVSGGALGASISVRNTNSANNGSGEFQFQDPGSNIFAKIAGTNLTDGSNNGYMTFHTSSATSGLVERARIDSSGRLGLNQTTPASRLHISESSSNTINIQLTNDTTGHSAGTDGMTIGYSTNSSAGFINVCESSSAFTIKTGGTGSANERLRIDSSGRLLINTTSHTNVENGSTNAQYLYQGYKVSSRDSTSNREHLVFYNPNGDVGSINTSGSNTSYTTASDYRLKENETAISDGITRLKTLKPYRFNFKVDKDTTVDGFFAHEVTPAVPEAITGIKDEVDSDNKPVYQGIDHSKLVPLLTAALQEAVTKIETLETKVATLEGS